MARPSDREYQLKRRIKELEELNNKLDIEVAQLKKKIEKLEKKDAEYKPVKAKKTNGGCPVCDSLIKVTDLPFGKLRICSAACGWRKVDHD